MAAKKMKLEDWLDDLCVRFIINLPEADLTSMARICFLVEEAHWFYEDFIRPLDNSLPSMTLRNFCLAIFQRCPLLAPFPIQDHIRAFEEFLKYKTSIPVRGAILLNEAMDSALLVKGWKKGAHWSFPRGKINMDEDDLDCAIREVAEETGYDVREAGLVPPADEIKYIETTFRDQQLRLYVFRDVPMDTCFEPKTRKEISKIQWYRISDLPSYRRKNNNQNQGPETDDPANAVPNANKFYMVAPFVGPLKKWVNQQRKRDAYRTGQGHLVAQMPIIEDVLTEDETSTQQEALAQPYQGAGRPEDILESASRELQRLLNVQPQTSVRAPAPPTAAIGTGFEDANQNKANALLAVLQGGAGRNGSPANSSARIPHTPSDNSYGQVAEPHSPHPHHAGQPGPYTSQAPPPPFHLQMQAVGQSYAGPPANQLGAPRPDLQQFLLQQQPQQPPPPPQQQQQQQPQQQSQYYHQNQPQNVPFQQQLPRQQQQPQFAPSQQTYMQARPPSYPYQEGMKLPAHLAAQQPPPPPVPLLHPQPLPPTVQRGLFARETFATPDVPEGRSGGQGMTMGPPPAPRREQPPLSNHAAALLSAFKSGGGASSGAAAADRQPPPPPPQQQHLNMPGFSPAASQSHQLHGARPQPGLQHLQYGHGPARSEPFVGQNGGSGQPQPAAAPPSMVSPGFAAPSYGQPMDQHRSALLGMFKQPQQQQEEEAPERARSRGDRRSAGYAAAGVVQSTAAQELYGDPVSSSSGRTIEAAARANGGPIQMHPELNLPFGALSLLTRPKGQPSQSGQGVSAAGPAGREPPRMGSNGGGSSSNNSSRRPSFAPAAAPPTSAGGRSDISGDQKQKLLSLFGRQQPSPTRSIGSPGSGSHHPSAKGKEAAAPPPPPPPVLPAAVEARRDSQTPISPADRNFLLGYLASMSGKT